MGKTKTVIVEGLTEEKISGKEKYEKKKKAKEAAKKSQVEGVGLKGGERIKLVTGEIIPEPHEEKVEKKEKKLKIRGKKYKDVSSKIDKQKKYSIPEAIKLAKETSYSKFNATVEMHLVTKKKEINLTINLPFPFGKQKKVEIASENTIEKLKKGKIDFDLLVATYDMMPKLLPFAKVLGPKGLMPNPKNQTLVKSRDEIDKFSANTLYLKTEKENPVVHTVIGKMNQKDEELIQNAYAVINSLNKKMIAKAYIKPTMGPSIKVSLD